MRNIALILTYEGTGYHGWQMQKNLATVQQTLEKAISMIVGHAVHVHPQKAAQEQKAPAQSLSRPPALRRSGGDFPGAKPGEPRPPRLDLPGMRREAA